MAPNGSGEGNTKSSPACRVSSSKLWCFTWNNYNGSDVSIFEEYLKSKSKYVFGYEVGEKGTPHLQGYVEFKEKTRPLECKEFPKQIHWEKKSIHSTKSECIAYCCKDGNYKTNMIMREPLIDPLEGKEYYPWQQQIVNLVDGPILKRKVHWYWESTGNTGKSDFTKHLCIKKEGCLMVTGKSNDVKFIIAEYLKEKDLKILIIDIPRISEGHFSVTAVEEILNGHIVSGKFESCAIMFNPPHVLVFANYPPPNPEHMSADRWIINEI